MKRKTFTLVNSVLWLTEVSTNINGNFFWTGERRDQHLRPIYFPDFAPIPFGQLMVLPITCIWNTYLLHFSPWFHPIKNLLVGLTERFIAKVLLWKNLLVTRRQKTHKTLFISFIRHSYRLEILINETSYKKTVHNSNI